MQTDLEGITMTTTPSLSQPDASMTVRFGRGGRSRLTAFAAGSVAALGIALAGCGTDQAPEVSGTDTHVHVDEGTPETAAPETVAGRALSAMFSWQPVVDSSPGAAMGRALPWLGGDLAKEATMPPAEGIRPLPSWQLWKQSGDVISASASVEPEPVQSTPYRQTWRVQVRQTVLHADGSSTPYSAQTMSADLEHTDSGWRLMSYSILPG